MKAVLVFLVVCCSAQLLVAETAVETNSIVSLPIPDQFPDFSEFLQCIRLAVGNKINLFVNWLSEVRSAIERLLMIRNECNRLRNEASVPPSWFENIVIQACDLALETAVRVELLRLQVLLGQITPEGIVTTRVQECMRTSFGQNPVSPRETIIA